MRIIMPLKLAVKDVVDFKDLAEHIIDLEKLEELTVSYDIYAVGQISEVHVNFSEYLTPKSDPNVSIIRSSRDGKFCFIINMTDKEFILFRNVSIVHQDFLMKEMASGYVDDKGRLVITKLTTEE